MEISTTTEPEKMDKPFLYLATRAHHPYALTEENASILIQKIGKQLDLRAYLGRSTPSESNDFGRGNRAMVVTIDPENIDQTVDDIAVHAGGMPKQRTLIAITKVKFYEHLKLSAERVGMCSYYQLKFTAEDKEFIKRLIIRKDPAISSEAADENCVAHYGFQRWGGVIIEIYDSEATLLESPIDVFASTKQEESLEGILAGYTIR